MRFRYAVLPIAAGLIAAPSFAEEPKPLPRIAVADPAKAKEDPDFAIQGEYVGEVNTPQGKMKVGAQIVALGGGKISLREYSGGLPGDGWDGKLSPTVTAVRDGEKAVVESKPGTICVEIGNGAIIRPDGSDKLERVERASPTLGAKPPEGAVVLFAGEGDEKNWNNGKLVELSDGKFLNNGATSKQRFGAFTAHIEFRLPWMPNSRGQGRGNSGVYLQDRYEIQMLDSFGLTGENNECGGFYTLHKPKVNMCLPPLVWQTYDIDFTPAEYGPDGAKAKNARATVRHNGAVIHDGVELPKVTGGNGLPEGPEPGPFQFQNHGDPVVYRNVWVVEKK